MQCKEEIYTYYTLKLSIEEAKWLQDVMQNPLHGKCVESEEKEDRQHRQNLYSVLNNCVRY